MPPSAPRRRAQLVAVLLFAAMIVGVAVAVSSTSTTVHVLRPGQPVPGADRARAQLAGIPQQGLRLGSPAAAVTLVEFADLQCPFCREYATAVLPTLIDRYVRTGRVQMIFRNLAFIGPGSTAAGRFAAGAAQQDRLWTFLALWYQNQQEENSGYVTPAYLRAVAGGVDGLDPARAAAYAASPAAQAQLRAAAQLAKQAGIGSTPAFLVGRTGATLHRLDYGDLAAGSFTPELDRLLTGR